MLTMTAHPLIAVDAFRDLRALSRFTHPLPPGPSMSLVAICKEPDRFSAPPQLGSAAVTLTDSDDLTVEYGPPGADAVKLWCVIKHREILATSVRLNAALVTARRMASGTGCTAWLVVAEQRIRIKRSDAP
jgi:hypothetical protein